MINENDTIPSNLKCKLIEKKDVSNVLENNDISSIKEISLNEFIKGKIAVLYFYPKDNTPGCTIEAQNFRNYIEQYEKVNAIILGCSRDNEKSHCKFILKQNLNFPLLFDNTGKITEAFDVWKEKSMFGKKYMGVNRSTFIVKDNIVIKIYPKVNVTKHAKEVLEFIKNL